MKIILASESPRRKELLKRIFPEFEVVPSGREEILPWDMPYREGPVYLARIKARAVASKFPDCLVIGADTDVFISNEPLGKPGNENQAISMLRNLSGKKHKVVTGCCVILGNKETAFSDSSFVTFRDLSDDEIFSYVKTENALDKAGGYGIQGKARTFVKKIEGDFDNVVGLPVSLLERRIKYDIINK